MKKGHLKAVSDRALTPPASLSDEGASWWRNMQREYSITDEGGLTLLALAAEARDRMYRAAALIREHGEVVFVEGLAPRANPACAIERDARAQMIAAMRGLHLDVEPVRPQAGRPPGR
jgi:phage terminase small subunit